MLSRENPLANHPRYAYVRTLGRGAFGTVVEAVDLQAGICVAIKLMLREHMRDEHTKRDIKREVVYHHSLHHPHVIQLYDAFILPQYFAISMECATGGNLYEYVTTRQYEDGVRKRLKEDEARWYFQQLILAVDYLHNVVGVANRDLKLENCLLMASTKRPHRRVLKLCDFGYSKGSKDSMAKTVVGTIGYMAPEVLQAADQPQQYDGYMADLWSCGVLLYTLVVGRYPFSRPDDYKQGANPQLVNFHTIQRIRKGEYVIPEHVSLSPGLLDLIARLLTIDPAARATLANVKVHPWFVEGLPEGALEVNGQCPRPSWDDAAVQRFEGIVEAI